MSDLESQTDLLRALHVPGDPLVLPNAWDVASARAVVAAGFPVVATTSAGVAPTLGYEDHEGAPGDEMLATAKRIAGSVDVPVTVDAEAGYGMEPGELVAALQRAGAAGCNLEDTNHADETLRDPREHVAWLRGVREAASDLDYGLVINARIDVFLPTHGETPQPKLVGDALERASAYLEAGADCVYPIALWDRSAVADFMSEPPGPVNLLPIPGALPPAELADLGVARISYASLLHRHSMEHLEGMLRSVAAGEPLEEG